MHVLCAGRPEGVVTIESSCDLLLTGGSVVTVDDERRVIEPGAVAIDGDRIVAVGPADELAGWSAARRVDCSGRAIIPGLVDCHSHLFQSLARGLGDGLALWPWLNEFMWPYAFSINAQEARVAALLGAAQAARAGTTCIIDNHYAPNDLETTLSIASAIDDVGLRGAVARGIVGPPTEVARRMDLASGLFTRSAEEEWTSRGHVCEARGGGGRVVVWPRRSTSPTSVRTCSGTRCSWPASSGSVGTPTARRATSIPGSTSRPTAPGRRSGSPRRVCWVTMPRWPTASGSTTSRSS